jgi:phosphoribosylamine--glycine ligase
MKVLVIGGGGREHALVWKIRQSPAVKKIFCAPGNGGTEDAAENVPIKADDLTGLLSFAKKEKIDLTVVGPELPLTLGIVDLFQKEGLPIFGPNREAARLEGSKAWTKQFLREEGIPTAFFEVFDDFDRAVDFLNTQSYPVVIKADGLAAGKGVLIANDRAEAVGGLEAVLKRKLFGEAGRRVVIEEFLTGEEASFQALVDGRSLLPLDSARDHKRIGEGDQGPNTGGMGAFSPAPVVDDRIRNEVLEKILQPTLRGLLKRGVEFRGVLYAGLMITPTGPKLLEYNVRFGDPETQPLMVRLEGDLVETIQATIAGRLKGRALRWTDKPSVCVVMAAHGYPGEVRLGDEIEGLDRAASLPETVVFHAGTKKEGGKFLTAGGRVLGVTAIGRDLRQARDRAYEACEKIYWKGVHYRRDIGRLK